MCPSEAVSSSLNRRSSATHARLAALADAGFHAVAPDMRGYSQTDRPQDADTYALLHLVGGIIGLLDALGAESAVIAGHDVGAPVAWNSALLRPDRIRAVAALSGGYAPRGDVCPTEGMKAQYGDTFIYVLQFQEPGKAEAELEADPRRTLRMVLYSVSGSRARPQTRPPRKMKGAGWLDLYRLTRPNPEPLAKCRLTATARLALPVSLWPTVAARARNGESLPAQRSAAGSQW